MGKLLSLLFVIFLSVTCNAQSKVSWSKEISLHREVSGLAVIHADSSGAYFEESHAISRMGWWGTTDWKSAILVKLNASLVEVYRKDYDKDLKDKNMESFVFIGDKLYLFASGYESKDRTLSLKPSK